MYRICTFFLTLFLFSQTVLAQSNLFVSTSDFSTGSTAFLQAGTEEAEINVLGVHSDAVVRFHNGMIYVINRLGQDNIIVLDAVDMSTPLIQFSVGNGTNPQDIEVVAADKAYITLYERSEVLVVDPRDGTELDRIDLSSFADDDGLPEAAQIVRVGQRIYVSCQRLDRNTTWGPADNSFLAVIDIESNSLIDVDPESEGVQGIVLSSPNPNTLIPVDQSIVVSAVAHFGDRLGGIEIIDTQNNLGSGLAVSEEDLGGDLNGIALVDGERGFAIISDENFANYVVPFNLQSRQVGPALQGLSGGYIPDLAVDGNRLIVADQGSFSDPNSAGLKIFDAIGYSLLRGPISTGLPPVSIAVLSDTDLLPTAVAEVAAALPEQSTLGRAYPNPFNASVAIPFVLARGGAIQLVIYDALGQAVRTLQQGVWPTGAHKVSWDGRNDSGQYVGNGTYFVRLRANGTHRVTKIMLLK